MQAKEFAAKEQLEGSRNFKQWFKKGRTVGTLMAEADVQGSDGHGVIRVPVYIRRIFSFVSGLFTKRLASCIAKVACALTLSIAEA